MNNLLRWNVHSCQYSAGGVDIGVDKSRDLGIGME